MSFKDQLDRLNLAATTRQEGVRQEKAIVLKEDLRELLHHFHRIDNETRGYYENSKRFKQQNDELWVRVASMRRALEFIQEETKEGYGKDGRIRYVAHQALSTTADQDVRELVEASRSALLELNCLISQINRGVMRKGSKCSPEGSVCRARDGLLQALTKLGGDGANV